MATRKQGGQRAILRGLNAHRVDARGFGVIPHSVQQDGLADTAEPTIRLLLAENLQPTRRC